VDDKGAMQEPLHIGTDAAGTFPGSCQLMAPNDYVAKVTQTLQIKIGRWLSQVTGGLIAIALGVETQPCS
jgi:hypothetical protein